jgi:hypothetical protein
MSFDLWKKQAFEQAGLDMHEAFIKRLVNEFQFLGAQKNDANNERNESAGADGKSND